MLQKIYEQSDQKMWLWIICLQKNQFLIVIINLFEPCLCFNGLSETPLHVLLLQRDKANEKCCFFTSFWKTSQTKTLTKLQFWTQSNRRVSRSPIQKLLNFAHNFDFVDRFFETLETVFDTFLMTDSFLKLFDISQKEPKKIEMVDATERNGGGKLTA